MVVILTRLIWYRAGLRRKRFCGSCAVGFVPSVQIGHNVSGLRQNKIAVREDRALVLAGYLVDLLAHRPAVGDDDILIGQLQVCQFLTDDFAVGAPVDMVERDRHSKVHGSRFKVDRDIAVTVWHRHRACNVYHETLSVATAQGAMMASCMPWMTFLSAGQIVARIPASSTFSPVTK